jgi:hypothetical protein
VLQHIELAPFPIDRISSIRSENALVLLSQKVAVSEG